MTHALIVGPRGVGKSTLIQRVLKELDKPVFGFETKKEEELADAQSGSPVYIYDAGKPHRQTPENLVGHCGKDGFHTIQGAFDRYAGKLRTPVPEGHIVLMDEIGFMESRENGFCRAVLSLLDGSAPVIAAVKDKEFPFLETVRSHPNCRCFYITEENRDDLYEEVLDFMKKQIGKTDLDYFISLFESRASEHAAYPAKKWDRRAEFWHEEYVSRRKGDERIRSAVDYLERRGMLQAQYDVADIGCGPGRFAAAFARRVRSVVGLDISERMVYYGREYLKEEGIQNARLQACDFRTMDIQKEGCQGAFDLVFCSMTPAVCDRESLQKFMAMSRAYCCSITHIYSRNHLRERIMREVFGKEMPERWNGRWFYSLFNVLFLSGYCPETSYDTRHQEVQVRPDEEYVEFLMEHMLPESENTKENAVKILSWMQAHADADGILTETADSCYGRILWDVRGRTQRPDYRTAGEESLT